MADLKFDKDTGIVTEGPYRGHKLADVIEYLETQASKAKTPDGQPPAEPPKAKTPEEELAERGGARVTEAQALAGAQFARMEQDDESDFERFLNEKDANDLDDEITVAGEKTTIRKMMGIVKKGMTVQQRITKGITKQCYMLVKNQLPENQEKLFAKRVVPPPEPKEDDDVVPPKAEEKKEEKKGPKATPPVATPTPSGRKTEEKEKKPKLVGNEKTERAAKAFGMTHDAYLLRLEGQGTTQDQIAAMTAPGGNTNTQRRKTVYG